MRINRHCFYFGCLITLLGVVTACQPQGIETTQDPEATPTISPSTSAEILISSEIPATKLSATSTLILPTETVVASTSTPWPQVVNPGPYDLHVMLVLPQEIGPNWYLSEDNFELFGWDLTLTGVKSEISPCSSVEAWYGLNKVKVDLRLSEISDMSDFDVLALMPASKKNTAPYGDLLESPETLTLIQAASTGGKVVYATCGGVRVLAAADILEGKLVTGEESFVEEFLAAGATYLPGRVMPVIDGTLVTTVNGLYFQIEDSEAVAVALEGSLEEGEAPGEADSIMHEVEYRGTTWTRTIGGTSADGGRAIRQAKDGGYIITGYTYSFGAGYADLYLIKTDKYGNLEWSQAYGGTGWEYGFSVIETAESGYLAMGYTTSSGMGGRDIYLVKTDDQGNLLWSKTYGGEGLEVGKGVDIAPDGGYILVGYTESFGAGQNDIYLVKTDADGNQEWERTFGGDQSELGMAVKALEDGGYLLTGTTGSFGVVNRDVYLVRTDEQGNELWSKTYGNTEGFLAYEIGHDLQLTQGDGTIIVGNHNTGQNSSGGELMNIYVLKTDEKGNLTWTASAGRSQFYDYGSAIAVMPDGGYTVAGTTKSGTDNNDIYLLRLDKDGNKVWQKSFGDFASEWGSGVALTADGGIVVVGHTNSFGAGSFDVWLLKVDVE